jgi:serine/threonine protein kinase
MAPQLRDQDRYDILGEHGRGGLGRVARAHDRELGRDIAIKELISRGPVNEVRFLREALITARLEHPGIVPVYEAGRWADGTPFYAMKLVSGRPLRDLIAERKTVDERIHLLHHVIAVADAIAYAHGRNIIHRDLKPANVIVGEFGETVVIDWGLAKDLSVAEESAVGGGPFRASHDDGLTSAGTVLGTAAYMAPEQARGEPVDQRADVFAIGAMLWELCSLHKLPPNFSGQRRHILRQAGIDPDLITIIEKAVDPDPARRYLNASALAADLKAFKAGARIAARRYSVWAVLMHWARRRRAAALSIAAGLALTIGGTTLYIWSVTAERDRADMSEGAARRANAAAKASFDELTLKHAQLLLTTDPSTAVDIVANYHGSDLDRAAQIRAEASGWKNIVCSE